jgi:two-component system, LytTR family, response regulator
VHAFERGAVDYLVEPIEASRLHEALERARQRLALARPAAAPATAAPRRLAIETQGGLVLLDPGSVTHAVLDGELVQLFTLETSFFSTDPVGDLHARLGASFERVHRRAILNMDHVLRLEPTPIGGFVTHLRGGARVEVSRQSARELRRKLRVG